MAVHVKDAVGGAYLVFGVVAYELPQGVEVGGGQRSEALVSGGCDGHDVETEWQLHGVAVAA